MSWLYCSEERKGLFLLSILGIGTGSLARLSPNGASLTTAHEARIRATPAGNWRAGITEQYELQIEKLRANAASLELISMPTFLSRPSTLSLTTFSFWVGYRRAVFRKIRLGWGRSILRSRRC